MLRTWSPLDDATERRMRELVDSGVCVHRGLGPGFVEPIYRNAFCLELEARSIPFEGEKSVVVTYKGKPVGVHRLDLVVAGQIVVELKAVKALEPVHEGQLVSYLKASGLRAGFLMNFGGSTLKEGLRRIVL